MEWPELAAAPGEILAIGYGSSDDGAGQGPAPQVCTESKAKLTSCGFTSPQACDPSSSALILCIARCIANAGCADIAANTTKNSFTICNAICQGAGPNDFICDDLMAYVKPAGICDGKYQCQDGSDEAHCADGGK